MKTEILNDNNYPFEIEPEAITTQFALFNVVANGREDVVLVLSPDDINSVIADREFAFADQLQQECFAQGYFSYVGGQPNKNKWVSHINFIGDRESSEAALAAVRNDVWGEVHRLFKGKSEQKSTSFKKRATDIRSTDSYVKDDATQRLGLAWLEDETKAEESGELPANTELNLHSAQPTVLIRKAALNMERRGRVM